MKMIIDKRPSFGISRAFRERVYYKTSLYMKYSPAGSTLLKVSCKENIKRLQNFGYYSLRLVRRLIVI